ncbi:MAG: glycosyltransferase [Gemella sp.]|nr:glycosyltransferase [Gemella sp.]
MKKVLILIPSFSSGGGAEKILSAILNNGDFADYKFDIIETERGSRGLEKYPANVSIKNYLYSYKYPNFLNILLMQLGKKFPNLLRKYLVRDDNYDIEIHFEIMYPDMPFSKNNNRKIHWVHGSIEDFAEDRYAWRKENYKNHFGQANKIVAISKKTRQSIIDLYPQYENKISLVYNGYDFESIKEKAKEESEIAVKEKSIFTLGRISKEKGSDKVLEIIKSLHEKGYKYNLYYVGSGVMEEELKQKVQDYGLGDYVHFLGYQSNPYKIMKNMSCLLSMSLQEGFSGAYVEAMSLGIPFVSTEVGGSEELSQNGKFGKVIYSNTQAEESLVNYLEGKEQVNKEEMTAFIENFTLENQVANFKKLLEGLEPQGDSNVH